MYIAWMSDMGIVICLTILQSLCGTCQQSHQCIFSLSAKSTQQNFTKLAKCRSVTFGPTTFKRSQTVGSDCKVVQQELCMFRYPSKDRGCDRNKCAVPISKILSKCSHLCVEKLLAVANRSLRLFPLCGTLAKCQSTKFGSHSFCKCNK